MNSTNRLSLLLVISVFGSPLGLMVSCSKSPEQKKQDAQEAAAQAFAEAFAKLGEANEQAAKVEEDQLAERTVKLGETIRLGSLDLTPVSAELRKVKVKSLFGDQSQEKGPFLVLTITAKNISEGQVFKPFMTAEVRDNFGNELGAVSLMRAKRRVGARWGPEVNWSWRKGRLSVRTCGFCVCPQSLGKGRP